MRIHRGRWKLSNATKFYNHYCWKAFPLKMAAHRSILFFFYILSCILYMIHNMNKKKYFLFNRSIQTNLRKLSKMKRRRKPQCGEVHLRACYGPSLPSVEIADPRRIHSGLTAHSCLSPEEGLTVLGDRHGERRSGGNGRCAHPFAISKVGEETRNELVVC